MSLESLRRAGRFVREPEHRTLVIVVAVALAIAAALAAIPLGDAVARKREDIARHRLMLDVARTRGAENAALARATQAAPGSDVRGAVDRVFSVRGIRFTTVDAQGNEGAQRIVVDDVAFDTLIRALAALEREDGVRVADAALTARVDSGTVRAELALTR